MKYLAIDISTTAQENVEDSPYLSWASKKGAQTPEEAMSKAGMHAEYGMVCCISAFMVKFDNEKGYSVDEKFIGTATDNESEEKLLLDFEELLDKESPAIVLCEQPGIAEFCTLVGHNIKDFTVPFLAKRYLGHGLKIPGDILAAMNGSCVIDIMKELACGGQSVMSLRSSAWLMKVDDPRSSMRVPRFHELVSQGKIVEVSKYTRANAKVAAEVFAKCVLGGLIQG